MSSFFQKNHRLLFYSCWLFIGLIQASFTELQDDEAYYWVYSRFLDWGYFDHPPMTGLLVKLGYVLFPNELGVRLYPLLLNLFSLLIIENLTGKKNPFLFYAIILSIAVLQLTGFVAVPDIPLIFFTALFFWCYKKFISSTSWIYTFLLGLSIAFLFYSKYHAVLIVLFTFISNWKLIKLYRAWIVVIVALILYAPHLWWQYQHDWVSLRYHLFESNVNDYKPSFTFDYIAGQLLLAGPVAGLILLPAAFSYKPTDGTEKALKYTMIGIYIFFFVSSFRGKVEGNWTSPALVPLIILAHQFLSDHAKWRVWLLRLLPATLVLVVFARIVMIVDILPVKAIRERYHAWKGWPKELKIKTEGSPVVFSNSYQRASKYWFYSGQPTYSQNHYRERKNNYNIWPIEDSLLGRKVYFMDIYDLWRFRDSIKTPSFTVGYRPDPFFISFAKIHIRVPERILTVDQTGSIIIPLTYEIPAYQANFIRNNEVFDTTRAGIFDKKGWVKDIYLPYRLKDLLDSPTVLFGLQPNIKPGKYYLRFAIRAGTSNPTHNSDKIELIVK